MTTENPEEQNEAEDQVLDVILQAGESTFDEVSTPTKSILRSRSSKPNLHSMLFPPTFYFRLVETTTGNAIIQPIGRDEAYAPCEPRLMTDAASDSEDDFEPDNALPKIPSRDILFTKSFLHSPDCIVCKVKFGGTEVLCKARSAYQLHKSIVREMECLQKVHDSTHRTDQTTLVRIPRLLGYVTESDFGRIIGLVR